MLENMRHPCSSILASKLPTQRKEEKSVNVDDFLAEELNQLSINEREEIIHCLKHNAETDEKLSLAKEMNKMSLKEREHILHDIHGVAEMDQETPELISNGLKELEDAIQVERGGPLSSPKSQAYDMAASMSPDYVQDDKFRLLFLRAARFEAQAAARRILEFCTLKLDLFGPEKLCQDIKIEDLSEDDMESLENGHMQLLPARDQAGRAIMTYLSAWMNKFKTVENIVSTLSTCETLIPSLLCVDPERLVMPIRENIPSVSRHSRLSRTTVCPFCISVPFVATCSILSDHDLAP
jgi:hypothetical protein